MRLKTLYFLKYLGSCMDSSMLSLPEDDASPEDILCEEYAEDIHRYLPKPGYMRKQPDITSGMMIILVDWLVEVGEEYKLCSETLYLAVNYLDRFLSLVMSYYQVLDEFVYITDDTYTKKQLVRMEQHLLRVLAFDLTAPTVHQFLMQYTLEEHICVRTVNLALVSVSSCETSPPNWISILFSLCPNSIFQS
uniref:Cyclin A1 n=1 Tax=Sinocyclocheilus rhinocerous TaxID=307959 RepID=A0A673LNV3_9TELE